MIVVVDAAIDHVDAAQAFGGAHVDDVVLDEEIGALDQLDPHLVGEEGMLVIGAVDWRRASAARSSARPRNSRRDRAQRLVQLFGIMRDRRDAVARIEIGKQPHHRLAILEHVGDARRRAAIVFEHVEIRRPDADHVDAGDMGIDALRRVEALHLGAEGFVVQDQRRRDLAGAQDLALVIDVVR